MKRERTLDSDPDLLKVHAMMDAKSMEICSYSQLLRVVGQGKDSINASQQALSVSKNT